MCTHYSNRHPYIRINYIHILICIPTSKDTKTVLQLLLHQQYQPVNINSNTDSESQTGAQLRLNLSRSTGYDLDSSCALVCCLLYYAAAAHYVVRDAASCVVSSASFLPISNRSDSTPSFLVSTRTKFQPQDHPLSTSPAAEYH